MAEGNPLPEINRMSVKIPPFWKTNPQIWFLQVEAQFAVSGITQDNTKYNIIIANIDSSVLNDVSDLLLNPPQENKYDVLKNRLIKVNADSEEKKLKTLLQDIELGDQKPSNLLRNMRELAGTRVAESVIKTLWLSRMPGHMQSVLTVLDVDLDKLADAADKLHDTIVPQINMVSKASPLEEINELKLEIEALKRSLNERTYRQSRDRSTSRTRYRSKSRSSEFCWYHSKFGKKANKCQGEPCKMASTFMQGN